MRKITLFVLLFLSLGVQAQSYDVTGTISPYGNQISGGLGKNIYATTPDNEVVSKSRNQLARDLKKGVRLYKKEKYDKAYPILSELAQWGIKESQALIGIMFIHGLHVDQSIEKGMGWLGVANEIDMDASRETYDHVYQQLTDPQKKLIDDKVAKYVSMYGMETQNLKCEKQTPIASNIPRMVCAKKPGSNSPLYPID